MISQETSGQADEKNGDETHESSVATRQRTKKCVRCNFEHGRVASDKRRMKNTQIPQFEFK